MVNHYPSKENGDSETIVKSPPFFALLQSGSTEAFEALVREWYPSVYRTGRAFCHNNEDALDVAQEVFLRAYLNIHSIHRLSSVGSWLNRITVTTALMKLRQRRRQDRIETALTQAQLSLAPRSINHLERVGSLAELKKGILSALRDLPDEYAAVCMLRLCYGYSTGETALALDISPETVKSRLHLARAMLKRSLRDMFRDQTDEATCLYGSQWWKTAA